VYLLPASKPVGSTEMEVSLSHHVVNVHYSETLAEQMLNTIEVLLHRTSGNCNKGREDGCHLSKFAMPLSVLYDKKLESA
jgi:hypothetical protein